MPLNPQTAAEHIHVPDMKVAEAATRLNGVLLTADTLRVTLMAAAMMAPKHGLKQKPGNSSHNSNNQNTGVALFNSRIFFAFSVQRSEVQRSRAVQS